MKNFTRVFVAFIIGAAISSCSSSKHFSDIDSSVDFSEYKTYHLISSDMEDGSPRTITDKRIGKAIDRELGKRNYVSNSDRADFIVYYWTDQETSTSYQGNSAGDYYGRYWHRWTGAYSYNTVSEVETEYGIINIDVVDSKSNLTLWTTTIKRTIPNKNQEEKLNKEIEKALADFPVNNNGASTTTISD
jgi:hypothetical protein